MNIYIFCQVGLKPFYKRKCPAGSRALFGFGGPGRNRTTDTRIFNPVC